MAVPTSYTESDFGDYLESELGPVATSLGWTRAGGDFDEPINDALFLIEETDVVNVGSSDISDFRTLGKLTTWRKVMSFVSMDMDFSADNASYKRSQLQVMAKEKVVELESEAGSLISGGTIETQRIDHVDDPYEQHTLAERTF